MSSEGFKSDFADRRKPAETLGVSPSGVGQSYPQRCPGPEQPHSDSASPLGSAMTISEVARMLGCSPWTVRQRYLPQGLPHLRASQTGRLVFFRNQVTHWILNRQLKGGKR